MFNIFKRKYKRSDWLNGLLNAENIANKYGIDECYLTYYNDIATDYSDITEFSKGYYHYIIYYENILKNL